MNTDDKAKELVEKFAETIPFKEYKVLMERDWKTAKQCAIICVEEIMNNILPIGARNGTERSQEIYWKEVKSKILSI